MFKFLTSFHYYRKTDLRKITSATRLPVALFGDSGAFSAASQGADVSLDEYSDWLNKWDHLLTVYSNLDVIGDALATMQNQRELERRGHRPLPVFHVGSPWSALEQLCEEYPYIALGGMVPYSGSNLGPWLVRCFKIAERYEARFHGFGQTRHTYLRQFPWYSVDSSSWGKGFRYGTVDLWDDRSTRFVVVKCRDHAQIYKYAELIRKHGGDPAMLADPALYRRSATVKIVAQAWLRYEQYIRTLHGPINLRTSGTSGPHLYLANTGLPNLVDAAQSFAGPHLYLAEANLHTVHAAMTGADSSTTDDRGEHE